MDAGSQNEIEKMSDQIRKLANKFWLDIWTIVEIYFTVGLVNV